MENNSEIKGRVKDFWNNWTCGTHLTDKERFTKEYFEEIEETRYSLQPEIFALAQFTRYRDKKVLEVGVGAGTDFLQWVRAGAISYGIDLTEEAVNHVHHRLSLYGLKAEDIKVGDSEKLPFEDNFFDLVYSWGVIHHTPNTEKALQEIIRVIKPGGQAKIMIYHRHSLLAWLFWVKHALLKFKPWKSVADILWNHMESFGTKAYTKSEMYKILKSQSVNNVRVYPTLSYYDKLGRFSKGMQTIASVLAWVLGGDRVGWFLNIEFKKD